MSMIEEFPANILCKSCGLCCTGHLFIWTKLRSVELDSIQSLGVKVFREPNQRGFNQPCPLWDEVCAIYESPHYPRFCGTYKCKLLKQVLDEMISLPSALTVVHQTKNLICELEALLPASTESSFRERLVIHYENKIVGAEFQEKVKELLAIYTEQFGVNDLIDF